jgi:PncC family amidohydrolase
MCYEEKIGEILIARGLKISTVESCTGGLLSSKLTDVSGSSNYITLNLVTYSNAAKANILGVSQKTLDKYGAVSEQCAYEMAQGLFKLTNSDICVSTTGIAGPTGGTDEKPVGLMYSTIFTPSNYRIYTILEASDIKRVEMKELFAKRVLKNIYEYLLQM